MNEFYVTGKRRRENTSKVITVIGITVLILLMCVDFAEADVNQNHECQGGHNCNDGLNTTALAEAVADAVSTSSSSADSRSDSDSSASSNNTVTINEVHPNRIRIEQAPTVAMGSPRSTAAHQQCFGYGKSDKDGSVVLGICWLQRDLFALDRFERLAALNMYQPAAEAYCSRAKMVADFQPTDDNYTRDPRKWFNPRSWFTKGSTAMCEASIVTALETNELVTVVNINVDQVAKVCEAPETTEVREYKDDGLLYVYDCTEREVIGKGQ